MRQRIGRVKSVSQKRPPPPLFGGGWPGAEEPLFHGSPNGSSIKVDGRPGAIVRRSMHRDIHLQ